MTNSRHRSTRAAAALAVVGLLAAGCGSEEHGPPPEPTDAGGTEIEPVDDEIQDDATAAGATATRPDEGAPDEALVMFDEPQPDVVPAPNGEMWDLHGSFDMDVMRDHFDATVHMTTVDVHCENTSYYWLREDNYSQGPTAGPTCFGDDGGSVGNPNGRLIHFVCQEPNTTARTLIVPTVPAEGSNETYAVFTPEYTTGNERECFEFSGEEVLADQTVISTDED